MPSARDLQLLHVLTFLICLQFCLLVDNQRSLKILSFTCIKEAFDLKSHTFLNIPPQLSQQLQFGVLWDMLGLGGWGENGAGAISDHTAPCSRV